MSQKFLPPLQADTSYRVADFEYFEYGHASFRRAALGEDTSILHLHLKNRTTLDLPVTDEALKHLMRNLMHAFPTAAIDELKQVPWAKKHLKD